MEKEIFLLEDDAILNETIVEFLEDNGFKVTSAFEGKEAEEILYEKRFDLILLDINVPQIDGFKILNYLRENLIDTPVIFISARDKVDDVEKGFELGCDDYLKKPFALRELLARVKRYLKSDIIKIDQNITFNPKSGEIEIDGKKYTLGAKESKLLKLFLTHPNEILSHEKIFNEVWDYDETPSDSSLRTYIKNLRKLIGKDKIISFKKRGYKYIAQK
ncbi:MAG: response regulator transcription factor [Epsilonproteobacteria bacterium]|nr:response regulator transcription factor [Campylobacterota bacterium]